MFHHCAFQAVEEQSLPQWGPEAQSEGQEAEFLIHLMWSVLLDGVKHQGEVTFQFIRIFRDQPLLQPVLEIKWSKGQTCPKKS